MRITSKGQVTIPVAIRESHGLLPETEVRFQVEGELVRLVKADRDTRPDQRGARIVAGVRGRADAGLTTDEILALTRG